ncbi:MAG TPA: hypothetical protein VMT52_05255, partial [Planctomycetota bacterium]|nr:hypothetical protein [Planctomycetota bacterium]
LALDPPPAAVHLAEEGPRGWTTASSGTSRLESGAGWGHARFELAAAAASHWRLGIEDSAPPSPVPEALSGTTPGVEVELPDAVFEECLKSQVAHLMMSLVGGQTRSSDPVNVPIPWQRTGAYIIAALAGAGKLEAARELSVYLAENDFYGGFGPEGDAPGLGIWALEEVAARVNRRDYDLELWPHVRRKAEWILKLLSAKEAVRVRGDFSIVPRQRHQRDLDLVAEPARDGLIIGRMDFHRPLLYINAVSYKGLVDAAAIAERLERFPEASRWRAAAAELEKAWARAFHPPASENDRTYISGLWPAWVAAGARETFREGLESRWGRLRDSRGAYLEPPLWTYFEIADAHQWLYLGREDRTWQTLRWFFGNQSSPGLYTWWEGDDEGNAFGDWKRIRGWVNPPNVQPHYWTTAEMILLQLDMLAHVDLAGSEPELVVGAGIPASWTGEPLAARGLSTRLGRVDWSWKDGTMRVTLRGRDCKVRLGPSFPRDARLEVERPEES